MLESVYGRYALFDEIASGGMATVHLGRMLGPVGFGRTVAIKRLHEQYLNDPEFVAMFMDEARVAARIRHPNVVPMIDVVQAADALLLVMEYVHGESLSKLVRAARARGGRLPWRVTAAILSGALLGLHAAHETRGPSGELLGVVHRDVSPQNIIVGADGGTRVLDFGIAKAAGRAQVTRGGLIKGKLAYMAPEQIRGAVDRRTDVFASAICLWEALTGKRFYAGMKEHEMVGHSIRGARTPPSAINVEVPKELDAIVLRGLAADPNDRFATAREMAIEIERAVGLATPSEIADVVESLAAEALAARAAQVREVEIAAVDLVPAENGELAPSLELAATEPRAHDPETDVDVEVDVQLPEDHARAIRDAQPVERWTAMSPAMAAAFAGAALFALVGVVLGGYAVLRGKRADAAATAASADSSASPPAGASATAPASGPRDD